MTHTDPARLRHVPARLISRRRLLHAGAAAAVVRPAAGLARAAERGRSASRLEEIARFYQAFTERHLIDADGLVRTWVSPQTLLPFTLGEISPRLDDMLQDAFQNSADPAGALTYEDSLMATGEFAMSQILRFQKSAEPAAREFARRAVRAILNVATEGRHYMPGYLPKPHGGLATARYSHEMSTDQYTKAIAALDHWRPLAEAGERAEIDRFLADAADFFISRRFRFPWRQKLIVKPDVHLHALALYFPLLQLAGTLVDPKYLRPLAEFEEPLETTRQHSRKAHAPIHGFNGITLFLDGFDVAIRAGHTDPRLPEIMQELFSRGAERIDETGFGKDGGAKASWAVRLAAGATLVRDEPGADARRATAERIMLAYDDVDHMRQREAADAGTVDGIDGVGIASWLLAYWRLRSR